MGINDDGTNKAKRGTTHSDSSSNNNKKNRELKVETHSVPIPRKRRLASTLFKWWLYLSMAALVTVCLSAYIVYRWYVRHKRPIDEMLERDQELKDLVKQVHHIHALYSSQGSKTSDHFATNDDSSGSVSTSLADEFALVWNAPVRLLYTVVVVGIVMYEYRRFFRSYDRSSHAQWTDEQMQQYQRELSAVHAYAAKMILRLCQHNRGAFVKLGQYVASLQYAVPREFTEELKTLQDQAPFHPLKDTLELFRDQFNGLDPTQVFDTFDMVPIASASIAQVHRATVYDNEQRKSVPVAVKVQHPGLLQNFDTDLFIMKVILVMTTRFFDFKLTWVLPEFHKLLYSELDFVNEGGNCERLGDIMRHDKRIVVPKIYWNCSTAKVLTMEWMDGVKLTDRDAFESMQITEKEVASLLVEAYARQIFCHGFLHGDPHEGNLLVRYNQEIKGAQLVFLDHGCYKELDEETRLNYADLWKAIVVRDQQKMKLHTRLFGIEDQYAKLLAFVMTFSAFVFSEDQQGLLDQRMRSTGKDWKHMANELKQQFNLTGQFLDVFDLVQSMFEKVDPAFLLLSRSNTLVRGLVLALGRPINSFEVLAKYAIIGGDTHQYLLERDIPLSMEKGYKTIHLNRMHSRPLWTQVTMWIKLLHLQYQILLLNMSVWFVSKLPWALEMWDKIRQTVSFSRPKREEEEAKVDIVTETIIDEVEKSEMKIAAHASL